MKKRESGVELMRILGMLMIISYHYFLHGGYTSAQMYDHQWQWLFILMFGAFGRMACGAFALTSGYYLVTRDREHLYRRIVPLTAELIFYSFAALAVVSIFHLRKVSLVECIKSLVPVVWGNWYVVNYMLIYLLIPFLNPWLRSMNEKTYRWFLLTVLLMWSVIPTLTMKGWEYSHIDFFLVMYIAGGVYQTSLGEKDTLAQPLESRGPGGINASCLVVHGGCQYLRTYAEQFVDRRKSRALLCV